MAKTLAQLQSQIAKLQKEAQALRAKEIAAVVAKIKSMMAAHGLTVADLGTGKVVAAAKKAIRRAKAVKADTTAATRAPKSVKRVKAAAATKAAKSSKSAAKSGAKATAKTNAKATRKTGAKQQAKGGREAGVIKYRDDAGNSWTGRGTRPKWFLAAVAAGKTPEQLMVA